MSMDRFDIELLAGLSEGSLKRALRAMLASDEPEPELDLAAITELYAARGIWPGLTEAYVAGIASGVFAALAVLNDG